MQYRERVYRALDGERAYQDAKGIAAGGEPHRHELESYVLYMDDYMTELKHTLSRTWVDDGQAPVQALHILRKVTALGVAAMEEHGAPVREGYCETCGDTTGSPYMLRCPSHLQRGHE